MTPTDPIAGEQTPFVTAVICTRDRGTKIVRTVESILASSYPSFELLIIDQSTTDTTHDALVPYLDDPRVRYLRTEETGVSRSRNRALREARSDLLLNTDDDCVVPADWIEQNVAALCGPEQPAIVFGDVVAAPDDEPGYTPESRSDHDFVARSMRDWSFDIGIGAAMSMRCSTMRAIGGYDELLGPGSPFKNGEDSDLTIRTLLAGHPVLRTRAISVLHYGSRPHEEYRSLIRGAMLGLGGLSGKLLRTDPLPIARFVLSTCWHLVIVPGAQHLRRGERPPVLGRAVYLVKGLWRGLRLPVDRSTKRFAEGGRA